MMMMRSFQESQGLFSCLPPTSNMLNTVQNRNESLQLFSTSANLNFFTACARDATTAKLAMQYFMLMMVAK